MFLDHTVYSFYFVTEEESVAIYFCQFYVPKWLRNKFFLCIFFNVSPDNADNDILYVQQ